MASQPDLTNVAISSGYATLIHTEESAGVSTSYTTLYDGDGTLIPMAFATTGVKIIDGSYDFDIASHDGSNGLKLGGTLVTASASELNYLDISTIGTAQSNKVLTTDSNLDVTGIRNLTGTGTAQFANFTATGDTTIGDSVANDSVAFNSTITTNLVFEGSTDNAYETTLSITDPTADRTWTIPDATDTSVGRATTDTLTNKTLTAPDINTPDIDGGTVDAITSLTVANNVDIGSYDLRAGTLTADGLTSGRVVFAGTNGVLSDDSDLSFSGATLSATNVTSSGTMTYGSLSDGSITITAFVDEDGMDSDSATLVPTQQSVKAYVDAQVTAQDLDFQGDSGGALNIDLDSETLDIAGGTGIDTSGSSNTLTVAIDSTVATLTGSQTLTNKTLASPVITTQFNIGSATITEAELEILDGASTSTAELNIIDGDTSATSTTLADADRVVVNDNGTMVQVALTDFEVYFESALDTLSNVTTVGALNAGSITSGFGAIDIGSSNLTTTGTVDLGATTVDSLSVSDGNITNVGSISLDSISADDSSIQFSSPIDFNSQNMTEVDIDSGTIDGATIATSDITVGSGKTLNVSAGTLTLADNQISGDKVEGGTIASTTITALTTAGISASDNIDIGSHGFRASTLTADSQTSGRVAIYGTNGLLSEDSDLTFSGSTLSVTDLAVSGTLTTTGSVQEVSTTNLNVQDPLILLNKYDSQPSNNAFDAGIVIKRGSSDSAPENVAIIWDESANTFSLVDTDDDGTTAGNITVTDYENLRIGALTADDASTFTSTISTATGSTIGNLTLADGSITSGSGALSFNDENLSTSGTLSAGAITGTSFIIGSADIGEAELEILDGAPVTTAELNTMDGDTSATSTTVADADRVVMNDGGTMKQVAMTDLSAYFDDEITAMPNLVQTSALNSGSITSGFGTIDTGSSNITTTGVGAFGSLDISGNVDIDGILEADAITVDTKALDEFIADTVGAMVGSNTETGIAVTYEDGDNTLDFVLGATQTTVTSLLNASLVAGRDADNQIKFSTDDQIIFRVAGGDGVTMKASGEIEATSLDISGDIDVDGTTNLDVVDIDGAVDMASTLAVADAITQGSGVLTIKNATGDGNGLRIFQDSSDASKIYNHYNGTLQLGVGNTTAITIDSSENTTFAGAVTITTATNYAMTIKSTDTDAADIFRVIADDDGALLTLSKDASDDAEMYLYDGSGNANVQISGNNVSYFNGGNVGIGVSSPGYLTELRVNDTTVDTPRLVIRQLGAGDSSLAFQMPDSPYGFTMGVDNSDSDQFKIGTGVGDLASNTRLSITTDANILSVTDRGIGVNTTTPGTTSTAGPNETYLCLDGGSNGGVIECKTSNNGDTAFMGGIDFVNDANADNSNNDADGKLLAFMRARAVTSDSNAHDDSGGFIQFATKPEAGSLAERMRITSDGNMVMGRTSVLRSAGDGRTTFSIAGTGSADYAEIQLGSYGTSGNDQGLGFIGFHDGTSQNALIGCYRESSTGDANMRFFTSSSGGSVSERMRIDSSGNVGIGAASFGPRLYSFVDDNEYAAYLTSDSSSGTSAALGVRADYGSGTRVMQVFFDGGSNIGEITYNGSALTYGGTSDERLKKDISSYTGGLSINNQKEVKNFTWKKHNKKDVGLIAQELYDILPSRVVEGTGEDEVDRPWQVDYPRLVPYLIQAVKELSAKVEALENA